MLVGHYEMLAGTLNSLGVQLDEVPLGRPTRADAPRAVDRQPPAGTPCLTLAGKRVLITGAASGIGRALAIASARKGAELFLTDVNDAPLQEVAAEIGRTAAPFSYAKALDVSDHEAVAADGGGDPRRARQPRRRHERRRDRRLGHRRDALARAVAAGRRRQPDGPDPRDRVLRAGDDRGRAGRAPGQRLLGRRDLRPAVARAVQRDEVRPARPLRGPALRPSPPQDRRQPRLPRRRRHRARRDPRDRRRRPRPRGAGEDDEAASRTMRPRRSRPPRGSSRGSSATATGSTPRATSRSRTSSSAASRSRTPGSCAPSTTGSRRSCGRARHDVRGA